MKTPISFERLVEGVEFTWEKVFDGEPTEVSRNKVYCTMILDELSRHCDSGTLFPPGVVVHNLGADFNRDVVFGAKYKFVIRLHTKIEWGHRKHAVFRVVVENSQGKACTCGQIGLYFP